MGIKPRRRPYGQTPYAGPALEELGACIETRNQSRLRRVGSGLTCKLRHRAPKKTRTKSRTLELAIELVDAKAKQKRQPQRKSSRQAKPRQRKRHPPIRTRLKKNRLPIAPRRGYRRLAELALGGLPRNLSTDLSKRDVLAYIRDHADGVGKRELSRDLAIGAEESELSSKPAN